MRNAEFGKKMKLKKQELRKGDRVERIEGYYSGMGPGDKDIILKVREDKYGELLLTLKKYGDGHAGYNFKRISSLRQTKVIEK